MTFKFKINIRTGDVEFEGTEEFVKAQILSLPDTIKSIAAHLPPPQGPKPAMPPEATNSSVTSQGGSVLSEASGVPESFGEWMHLFSGDISDQDKALVAGQFVQNGAEKKDFKTAEVNSILKDHGFKLSNPSKSLNDLVSKKLLFQTRKEGKLKFLRISKPGEARIAELHAADR